MKILFGVRNDGPDAYYRAKAPAAVLHYRGQHVACRQPILGEDADEYDVLIMQRHASPVAELMMREFQALGKPVIYDVDDWLFGVPPTWPVFHELFDVGLAAPKPALSYHERMLRQADMVTCTTPTLAVKLAAFNEQVRVVPNCVLMGDWDSVPPAIHDADGPVIGWFGSINHWDTWVEIAGAIDAGLAGTPGWLAVIGLPEVLPLLPDRLAERTFIESARPFRQFDKVRRLIKSFDVGIAWLPDAPAVYRCKSPLKALQYGAAGVPIIASKTVYASVLEAEDGPYAYIDETPDSLSITIREVAMGHIKTGDMARAWQQRVWEHHSYETQSQRWLDVIEEALGVGL